MLFHFLFYRKFLSFALISISRDFLNLKNLDWSQNTVKRQRGFFLYIFRGLRRDYTYETDTKWKLNLRTIYVPNIFEIGSDDFEIIRFEIGHLNAFTYDSRRITRRILVRVLDEKSPQNSGIVHEFSNCIHIYVQKNHIFWLIDF